MVGFPLVSVLLATCICASVAFPQSKPEESENSGLELVAQENDSNNEIVDSNLESASVKFPGFHILPWFGPNPSQSDEDSNSMKPSRPSMPSWWFGGGGGLGLGWGGFRPRPSRPSRPTTSRPIESDEDSSENSNEDTNSNQDDSNENDLNDSNPQESRRKRDDSDENSNQSDSNESNDIDSKESRKKKDDSNSDSQSDENQFLDSESDSWEN